MLYSRTEEKRKGQRLKNVGVGIYIITDGTGGALHALQGRKGG